MKQTVSKRRPVTSIDKVTIDDEHQLTDPSNLSLEIELMIERCHDESLDLPSLTSSKVLTKGSKPLLGQTSLECLQPITQAKQSEEQSRPRPKNKKTVTDNSIYGLTLVNIKALPTVSADRFKIELVDRQSCRIYEMVTSSTNLKANYLKQYIKFLEAQIYHPLR